MVSVTGDKFFLLFVDDYSWFSWVYFLSSKDETLSAFKMFQAMVMTQFSTSIKAIRFDWGGEFQLLHKYLLSLGVQHQVSCPYTPQQNGRVE